VHCWGEDSMELCDASLLLYRASQQDCMKIVTLRRDTSLVAVLCLGLLFVPGGPHVCDLGACSLHICLVAATLLPLSYLSTISRCELFDE